MLDRIPRIELLAGPTPLERMARAGAAVGHDGLWIKRDDVMSLGLGGNKVRSLEYWLGEAATTGGDMLVVAGAPASNQCRLVAAAGARMGIETLVLYAGDEPGALGGNAMLTRLFGARIRWLGPVTEAERGRRAAQVVEELRAHGRRPYLIGNPVVAALGYVRAAQELAEQVGALDLRHVLLPGSMGPTEAGFIFGSAVIGAPWTVHLVSVEYPEEELRRRVATLVKELQARTGIVPPKDPMATVRMDMDELGGGYGVATSSSRDAAAFFATHEALVLEQTYVAKTFASLLRQVRQGAIAPDEPACVLHTGGVPALFAQQAG